MQKPLVSVVIPIYNTGRAAVRLVNTILKDKYSSYDIILVDDGSTDDSLKTLKKITDSRVRVFHQKNSGASAARNLGLKKVKGEYVIFLDSDDEIKPDFLPQVINAVLENPNNFPVTGMYRRQKGSHHQENLYPKKLRTRGNNESIRDYVLWLLIQDGRMYPVVNKIFQTDIIKKNHLQFDPNFTFAEDLKFVLDYLKYAPGDIKFIQTPLYIYNFNNSTSLTNTSALRWRNWQKSFDHLVKWCGKLSPTAITYLSLIYARWRVSHTKAGQRDRAKRKANKSNNS